MRTTNRRHQTPPWLSWSYTKLRVLHECPLKFWFQYIERRTAPQAPILTVGAALHYQVFRFFRVNYKSPESFVGAWKHFWIGVTNGDHGPGGHREPAVQIDWKSDGERWYWLKLGSELLAKFFERHAADRGTNIAKLAEARFRIANWRGFTLNGTIDRVDEFDDHVVITDYKMGLYPAYMLGIHGSSQPIFYRLAYDTQLARRVGYKPIQAMQVENLFSGASQRFVMGVMTKLKSFTASFFRPATMSGRS